MLSIPIRVLFMLFAASAAASSQLSDSCCLGPYDAFANPLGITGIAKVSISCADASETSTWWSDVLLFQAGATLASPLGDVTPLTFRDAMEVELLQVGPH